MLRLAFVTGSLPDGGAERHTIALLKSLALRGHECHAVCVKPTRATATSLGLPESSTLQVLNARRYHDRRAIGRFTAWLDQARPHAIVAANGYALLYSALARRRAAGRSRLLATWHTTRLLGLREQVQMAAYRLLFWNADCTVFLCERQRRHWRRRGLFSRRNEVILNGVDPETFRDRPGLWSREQMRTQLGLGQGDYVIALPALLRPEKNHLQLVEAIAQLRRLGLPARALMIGDGPQRAVVEARARQLGVATHVLITGMRPDVRPYLAAADVATLCSMTETFSLAALEAMSMGKPVVLSEVGGAAEMVVPGWNGLLFPAGDTDAYVNCLARLGETGAAMRMGVNARHAIVYRFSAAAMTGRYEQLLAELCGPDGLAHRAGTLPVPHRY